MKLVLIKAYMMGIAIVELVVAPLIASTVASVRVTFKVVDERCVPVSEASICGGGWIPDGSVSSAYKATTDTNGITTVDLKTAYDIGCTVSKEGHYDSEFYYAFGSEKTIHEGRWPQSGFTNIIVLKRIINPVPMYVKAVEAKVPVLGQNIGYDLMKGDWVSPHGKGVVSDLVVCVTGKVEKIQLKFGAQNQSEIAMRVTFSNPGDGIQTSTVPTHNEEFLGSALVTDHEAPVNGYQPEYQYHRRVGPDRKTLINSDRRYGQIAYFRIRSKLDEKGQVVSAMYGTMRGDFYAIHRKDGQEIGVYFFYVLNSDGTRNVECKQGANLLR